MTGGKVGIINQMGEYIIRPQAAGHLVEVTLTSVPGNAEVYVIPLSTWDLTSDKDQLLTYKYRVPEGDTRDKKLPPPLTTNLSKFSVYAIVFVLGPKREMRRLNPATNKKAEAVFK